MSAADTDEKQKGVDKVRASKAGHAFHEAWAARSALELLLPTTDLVAITLEGLDEQDEQFLGADAVEIADLVRYYGGTNVEEATRVTVVQFKYSIAKAEDEVVASDLASTLAKFAKTDADFRAAHGDDRVLKVVSYEFATNQPVQKLRKVIAAASAGTQEKGDVGKQVATLKKALKEYPHPVADLLQRLELVGSQGSLIESERVVAAKLASWSDTSDPDARLHLFSLRNLIREKAGHGSETDKRIDRIAVLAALGVMHEDQLYPTPAAFPEVEVVIQRQILTELADLARAEGPPLVVHAAGGMGKTVLMSGLEKQLRADGPVVLFDGFGAGRWRVPTDGRHLPEKTLVHLANLMAGQGLCDILLPVRDQTGLLQAFYRRLKQAVETARQIRADACISLVLDAIDHAGIEAKETGTTSFAHLLLLNISEHPIAGVRMIVSCRTERRKLAIGRCTSYRSFVVPPFTIEEVRKLVRSRVPDVSAGELAALLTRSGRNPRCLDNLVTNGRPFDPVHFPDAPGQPQDQLEVLLRRRLADARQFAIRRGASEAEIEFILAGLALLVPPVPIEELAAAHGMDAALVESFAADLAPLLERTRHGLMFRDEPTETLIRSEYGTSQSDRDQVIAALQARQHISNYAARALPPLLTSVGDADQLFQLAFDRRVPQGASQVSARDIRLSRITAAIALAGELKQRDDLFRLLLEASLVAGGHKRADRFLYEHPDLVAISQDPEALRRLAATNIGWPGGKHAALALANAFVGDRGEARRHASRAIAWHNWAAQTQRFERFRDATTSRYWDDISFAYVEMLAGNALPVAEFFALRSDGAFDKFHDLFDLLERHQHSPHPPEKGSLAPMFSCQLPSPAYYSAALRFGGGDPAYSRKLIQALAAIPPREYLRQEPNYSELATVLAAALAVELGLEQEAAAILEAAALAPPNAYDYSSQDPNAITIQISVLAAGVRAALSRRRAGLSDIAPVEFIRLVPVGARSRGDAQFVRVLEEKLEAPKSGGARYSPNRRNGLEDRKRLEYSQMLGSRVKPLLGYAQDVADILRAPDGKVRIEMVTAAFDRLVSEVARCSNYPYRDGKEYLARTGFRVIFGLADSLGALDARLASRMGEWVASAPGLFTPDLTRVVARLSRIERCHDAALCLAGHIESRILLNIDVETRITSYGELARAVWRIDMEEAAAYFRRAIDLTHALDTADFDQTNHLFELAGHYSGPELSPNAAHTLVRILELNQHERGEFPSSLYSKSKAMVPIAGRGTLAILSRLDDRAATRLDETLGPTLTLLVHESKLSADLAAALFGLSAPNESWTWHISDFAAEVIERLPQARWEWFFDLLLVELDRVSQLSPEWKTIENLNTLAARSLPAASTARKRIEGLLARLEPRSESLAVISTENPTVPSPIFSVDITNPEEIDRLLLAEDVDQRGQGWPVPTLKSLARQANSPACRRRFVCAVVEATAALLVDKLDALGDFLEEWGKSAAAMRDVLPTLGLRLATKHAAELAGSSTGALRGWSGLKQYFLADGPALVEHVVAALRSTTDTVGGDSWLGLAVRLAPGVSNNTIAEGFERLLANISEKLPTEVGDGPWDPLFTVPGEEAACVAGLVWARLGHPVAAQRWRAAHAVRRLAAVERFDVLDRLIERFSSVDSLPFGDAKLPFYAMHAQLWLLISLARVAKDDVAALVPHRIFVERIGFSVEFPHVVMRAFAADILRELAHSLDPEVRVALIAKLASVNRAPYPALPRGGSREQHFYASKPDTCTGPENSFQLDHDFNKYHVKRLCDVFNCPGWEIKDRISVWVRHWNSNVRGMNECPRSIGNSESWPGNVPGRDRYGGYLGWHALMLVAGELLATRSVVEDDWDGDPWGDFLKEYALTRDGGLWLADFTDLVPLDLPEVAKIPMPRSGQNGTLREDGELLAPLFGLQDGKVIADWLPVAGDWRIGRDTTATIQSVLANAIDAQRVGMALLSMEAYFRWLPVDQEKITEYCGANGHSVQPWLSEQPSTECQLDKYDPYGTEAVQQSCFPSDWTLGQLGAVAADGTQRHWVMDGRCAFRVEAWGVEHCKGEHAWSEGGSRLFANRSALFSLIERAGRSIVIFVKLQKFHQGKAGGRAGDTSAFSHRTLVVVINERGEIWSPRGLSRQAKEAISTLDAGRRRYFYSRFRAIAGLPDELSLGLPKEEERSEMEDAHNLGEINRILNEILEAE